MRKTTVFLLLMLAFLAATTTSCVTSKKVRYLRDMPPYGVPLNERFEATIAPYDELSIYVLSDGKNEELVKPFNVLGSAGNTASQNRMGYLVDVNGNIEFPVLGELHVAGMTRLQLQDLITDQLKSNGYLSNPNVMVRFLNFKVFVLGTESGKVLNITEERCTFLEALAMAGGLDLYTRRDRIGVMREVNGKVIFLRKLVRGGSEHSFGIHVAKLAGMPASIVERANKILADLERAAKNGEIAKPMDHISESREGMQLSFFQLDDPVLEQIREEVTALDINNLTPLEALNKLSEIKRLVGGK